MSKAKAAVLTALSIGGTVGENVPILGELLRISSMITASVEALDSADHLLRRVFAEVVRVDSTVRRFDGTSVSDDVLAKLEMLKLTCLEISRHVAKWSKKSTVKKMWGGKTYEAKFDADLTRLSSCLDALSRSVTVDTNLDVKEIRLAQDDAFTLAKETNNLLKDIAPELAMAANSAEALKNLREAVLEEHGNWDELSDRMDGLMKKRGAEERRNDQLANMELDERDLEWYEEKPFAKGSFGSVFRAKYEREVVAAKILDVQDVPAKKLEAVKKEFQSEVALMASLRSQNIVQILGAITRRTELVIVMEYCVGGSLRSQLDDSSEPWPARKALGALLDVATGMKYLHSRGTVHRDLKSLNVLIDRNGKCKVSDFGQSKSSTLNTALTATGRGANTGTVAWNAPEVMRPREEVTMKADVYSFAVVIFEVVTTELPWEGLQATEIMFAVCFNNERPQIPEDANEDLKSLAEDCWKADAKERPAFSQIVQRLERIANATPSMPPAPPERKSSSGRLSLTKDDSFRERMMSSVTRAEADKARAEEEKARAEEEKARAEEEKARAEEEKAKAEEEKAKAVAENKALAEKLRRFEEAEKIEANQREAEKARAEEEKARAEAKEREREREKMAREKEEAERAAAEEAKKKRAEAEKERRAKLAKKFTSNEMLKEAAKEWVQDKEKAKEKYGPIEDWDVSEVTSFYGLFEDAKKFNEDLSRWDVSNCTNMYAMFQGCSAFNSDLSSWNTSNCRNMYRMFESCSAFNSDLSSWNTSNCTNMYAMFSGCSTFNSDLSSWNTSNCTNMSGMFAYCSAFNSDLSSWNTSNCTNMVYMFHDCSAFNSDLSSWNMSKVEDTGSMFYKATAMKNSHKPKGVRKKFILF